MLRRKNGLRIGLQFFADGADAAPDMQTTSEDFSTGTDDADFLSGLLDDEPEAEVPDDELTGNPQTENPEEEPEPQETEDIPTEESPENREHAPDISPVIAKFGGKDIPLDRAAAESTAAALGMDVDTFISTVQKGMNYDLLPESQAISLLDQYAADSGMNRAEYIAYLAQNRQQSVYNRELDAVRQQYPDIAEDAALELAQVRMEARQRETQSAQEQQRQLLEMQQQKAAEDAQKPWLSYIREHPEIKSEADIPPAVIEGVKSGLTPIEAHLKMELEALKSKQSVQKKNTENKNKTPGSLKGVGDIDEDAFLAGLFGR